MYSHCTQVLAHTSTLVATMIVSSHTNTGTDSTDMETSNSDLISRADKLLTALRVMNIIIISFVAACINGMLCNIYIQNPVEPESMQ